MDTNQQQDYDDFSLPVNSGDKKRRRLLVLGIIIVVAAAAVWGVLTVVNFRKKEVSQPPKTVAAPVTTSQTADKILTLSGELPLLNEIRSVFFDKEDGNIIWLVFDGAIAKYNLVSKSLEKTISGVNGLDVSPGSAVHKGDNFFFTDRQGGFEQLNLKTGQRKYYTTKEGLVNNYNLFLVDDPANDDIWIGTFDGLSRFNTVTEKFDNFTTEMSPQKAQYFAINRVVVDKDYVWVAVAAHAYNQGGIARFDKAKGTWQSWGPETFGETDRVDFFGIDAFNNQVFAAVSLNGMANDKFFQYDFQANKWKMLPLRQDGYQLSYLDNKIYFLNKDRKIQAYNLLTKKIIDTPLGEVVGGNLLTARDGTGKRLVFVNWQPGWAQHPGETVLYDATTNRFQNLNISIEPSANIKQLVTADKNKIFFVADENLLVYDLINKTAHSIDFVVDSGYDLAGKVVGDRLVLIKTPQLNEMGGEPEECLGSSISILSLADYKIQKTLAENKLCLSEAYVANNSSAIFLVYFNYETGDKTVRQLDLNNLLISSQLATTQEDLIKSNLASFNVTLTGGLLTVIGANGQFSTQETLDNSGDEIKINIKNSPTQDWQIKSLPVVPEVLGAFDGPPDVNITNLVFDASDQNLLWISTNRGLLTYNFATQKHRLFTTQDGLISNNYDNKIISLPGYLVVYSGMGAFIYQVN